MSNCSHEAWDFGALQCPNCGAVKGHVADADYAKLEAEAQALRDEVEKAQNALAFTEQWYGVRYERLWHWAHAELNEEQKRRYFNIVANGTAEHSEPPTYAQQLCRMKNRYECAEKEAAALRARVVVPREFLERIRSQLDLRAEFDQTYPPETQPVNDDARLFLELRALLSEQE
ncbi:TPA: hypothetical protein ACXN3I_005400 [Pseudomonas aeruginosa]